MYVHIYIIYILRPHLGQAAEVRHGGVVREADVANLKTEEPEG